MADKKEVAAYLAKEPGFLADDPEARAALGDFSDLTYTQWEAFLALHYGADLFVYATEKGAKVGEAHLKRLQLAGKFPGRQTYQRTCRPTRSTHR